MNDIVQLLQQIKEMNSAWLDVAVSAQFAFDTIDAAALKMQEAVRDTIANVADLNNSLAGIDANIEISINSGQIDGAKKQLKQLNSLDELALSVKRDEDTNKVTSEGKAKEESSSFTAKVITTATKSIVKGSITSVIEDKALRGAVKEELATGFRGLVADEAGEFITSSAGGILGDVLGGGVAGVLEKVLGFFGPEGIAASLILGGGVKIFKNMMKQGKVHYPADAFFTIEAGAPVRYTDNTKGLPHIENYKRKDPSLLFSRMVTDYGGKYQRSFDLARKDAIKIVYTPDTVDTYDPKFAPEPPKGVDLIGPKQVMLNSIVAAIANMKKEYPIRGLDYVGEQIEDIRLYVDSLDKSYLLRHPKEKISPYRKLFNEGTTELDNFIFENNIERSGGKRQTNQTGTVIRALSGVSEGKVINININKAFIENFSIHAQNIQQGYDNLKQKVEEIFLEILNSANAIHE